MYTCMHTCIKTCMHKRTNVVCMQTPQQAHKRHPGTSQAHKRHPDTSQAQNRHPDTRHCPSCYRVNAVVFVFVFVVAFDSPSKQQRNSIGQASERQWSSSGAATHSLPLSLLDSCVLAFGVVVVVVVTVSLHTVVVAVFAGRRLCLSSLLFVSSCLWVSLSSSLSIVL